MADGIRVVDRLIDQADVTIVAPSTGQVLRYNGSVWANAAAAGGSPGGSDTQLQFNNVGAFGGIAGSAWDGSQLVLPTSLIGGTESLGALTLIDSVVSGDAKAMALYNDGGGAGASVSMDMYCTSAHNDTPQVKLKATDDGAFSAHLLVMLKVSGLAENSLFESTRFWTSGNVSIGTNTDSDSQLFIKGDNGNQEVLTLKAAAAQIEPVLEVLNSGDSRVFSVDDTGIIIANGSGLTQLNASNLASGTVPTARLGSGTADNTTFLRGDQTYAVPASSSGLEDTVQLSDGAGGFVGDNALNFDPTTDLLTTPHAQVGPFTNTDYNLALATEDGIGGFYLRYSGNFWPLHTLLIENEFGAGAFTIDSSGNSFFGNTVQINGDFQSGGQIGTGTLGPYRTSLQTSDPDKVALIVSPEALSTVDAMRVLDTGFVKRFYVDQDGQAYLHAPDAAPTDARINNSTAVLFLDETANEWKVRVRYSDGTYGTGTVCTITKD